MTTCRLELAREDWRAGERGRERVLADPQRARCATSVCSRRSSAALAARLGQTYTLADLFSAYDDAERWAREAAQRTAPGRG